MGLRSRRKGADARGESHQEPGDDPPATLSAPHQVIFKLNRSRAHWQYRLTTT